MKIEVTLRVDNYNMSNTRYLTDLEVRAMKIDTNDLVKMSAKELMEAILQKFHVFDGSEKSVPVAFDVT